METYLKADLFFFITAVAVVLLTFFLVAVLYYVIQLVRNLRDISQTAKTESELVSKDLGELRQNVREQGLKFKHFSQFFSSIYSRNKRRSRSNK